MKATKAVTRPEKKEQEVREVRLGRNFVRVGDAVKVRLPSKTQFTSGWKILEFFTEGGVPHARVCRQGKWRLVCINTTTIRRVAQTKRGERKQ